MGPVLDSDSGATNGELLDNASRTLDLVPSTPCSRRHPTRDLSSPEARHFTTSRGTCCVTACHQATSSRSKADNCSTGIPPPSWTPSRRQQRTWPSEGQARGTSEICHALRAKSARGPWLPWWSGMARPCISRGGLFVCSGEEFLNRGVAPGLVEVVPLLFRQL